MWKVTHEFKEVKHDGHIYKVGDVYPAEGFEADAERVAFLQKQHEQYGVSFLEETEEEPKEDVRITAVEEPEQEPEQAQETQEQPEGMETAQEQAPAKAKRAPRTKKTSSDAKGDE